MDGTCLPAGRQNLLWDLLPDKLHLPEEEWDMRVQLLAAKMIQQQPRCKFYARAELQSWNRLRKLDGLWQMLWLREVEVSQKSKACLPARQVKVQKSKVKKQKLKVTCLPARWENRRQERRL